MQTQDPNMNNSNNANGYGNNACGYNGGYGNNSSGYNGGYGNNAYGNNESDNGNGNKKRGFWKGLTIGVAVTAGISLILYGLLSLSLMGIRSQDGGDAISDKTIKKANEIKGLIDNYYLFDYDDDTLQEYMLMGMVAGLGDDYSVYYDEASANDLMSTATGSFGGIGAVFMYSPESGLISVESVYIDSPAEKGGLKAGDVLMEVDGEDVTGYYLEDVVSLIKGEKGTDVTLKVLRDKKEVDIKCTRDEITVKTVEKDILKDNIGYIKITSFTDVTTEQFEDALNELVKDNVKGLVIDLRDNPGGTVDSCVAIADDLLPKGLVVYTEDKNGEEEDYSSDADMMIDVPIAVLVNENSASASEILSGALKDYKIGSIVGTTTFGKGIVQSIIPLDDGSYLKLTTSEYFSPNGTKIHGIGVKPDYEVTDPDPEDDVDEVLDVGIDVIEKKMK